MNITTDQVNHFLKNQFRSGDIVVKLIFVNIGIYLLLKIIAILEWLLKLSNQPLLNFFNEWLFLPAKASEFLYQPYTLISYQFIHDSFWHLLVNVMLLFFFGKMLISIKGFKQVLPIYFLGGIFGGIVFVLFHSLELVPVMGSPISGASASIMALMGAVAFLRPDYPVKFFLVFDVKLKWLALGFAVLNLLNLGNIEGAGPGLIHLAGIAFGVGMMYLDSINISLSKPFNNTVNMLLALFNKKPQPRVTFVNPNPVKKGNSQKNKQKKIDEILDKISTDGYASLSKSEKDFLFQASKKS